MAQRRRPARDEDPAQERLILDSGAVIALARDSQRARAFLRVFREAQGTVLIPAVVVAETVRGANSDASTNRVLKLAHSIPELTEPVARTAGALLGQSRSSATVDAVVVAHAIHVGGAFILTSDLRDIMSLASFHPEVRVLAV